MKKIVDTRLENKLPILRDKKQILRDIGYIKKYDHKIF